MGLDLETLTSVVRAALPEAVPDVVASLFAAWIPHVEPQTGLALVDDITGTLPAPTWRFADQQLARWPEVVRERALMHIRVLPRGEDRILALCEAARHLTLADRREALAGILDGTLGTLNWQHVKPRSNQPAIAALVRTLPSAWQEEWIASQSLDDDGKPDLSRELLARHRIGLISQAVARELWARIDHVSTPLSRIPPHYSSLVPWLPADLRQEALTRTRACTSERERIRELRSFDDELTDAERCAIVGRPGTHDDRQFSRGLGSHLGSVRKHLPFVPVAQRLEWLEVALSLDDGDEWALQHVLTVLIPALSGAARRQAEDALVASVLRAGLFTVSEARWELLPDDDLAPLLWRLRDDPYGHRRDEVIAHVIAARDPELVDRCLRPLLEHMPELEPDAILETVTAMAPWLAERTDGAAARTLAEIAIPSPTRTHNPQYWVLRVHERNGDDLETA